MTGSHWLSVLLLLLLFFFFFFLISFVFFFSFVFHFTLVVMIKEDNFGHLMDLHGELGGAFLYFGQSPVVGVTTNFWMTLEMVSCCVKM